MKTGDVLLNGELDTQPYLATIHPAWYKFYLAITETHTLLGVLFLCFEMGLAKLKPAI